MFGYVYRTRNKLNDAYYVGQHHGGFNPKYLGSGLRLVNSVKKYGRENFEVELLEAASYQEELDALEIHFIKVHCQCGVELYNILSGGASNYVRTWSEETRKKMSDAKKGKKQSPEHILNRTRPTIGLKRTPETKLKQSLVRLGTHPSEETKAKLSAYWKDPTRHAQNVERLRQCNLGRKASELSVENRRQVMAKWGDKWRGIPLSPETKMKMSEAAKKRARPSQETKKKMSDSRKAYHASLKVANGAT